MHLSTKPEIPSKTLNSSIKISHTGDKASLDRCGQQHQCHRRVDQEQPKTRFFWKTEKIILNAKTQKCLEICKNQRYTLRPEVSIPSGSVVSGWTKNTQKPEFFENRKKSSKTQKLKNIQRYAKISDTPFDQRSLIHREAWFLGGPRIPKNPIFLINRKNHPKRRNSKTSRDMPKLAIRPMTRGL